MRKSIALRIGVIAVVAFSLIAFSGCEFFGELFRQFAQPYGRVVDARSGEGVAGATVTLSGTVDGQSVTQQTTTDTDGQFDWADVEGANVEPGVYTLTATKSGSDYTFITRTVEIGGFAQNIGDVLAFATENELDIVFALLWNDSFDDVDIYMTYPTVDTAYEFEEPNQTINSGAPITNGFVPYGDPTSFVSAGENGRQAIYFNRPTTTGGSQGDKSGASYDWDDDQDDENDTYRVELDRDDTDGGGPESIIVRTHPASYTSTLNSTTGGGTTGLPSVTGDRYYTWVGVAQVYADAFAAVQSSTRDDDAQLASGTDGADAVLYVFQQASGILGEYRIPRFTDIQTASLVRVNMFWDSGDDTSTFDDDTTYFQIVPNIQITDKIRGIEDEIVTISGRTGR